MTDFSKDIPLEMASRAHYNVSFDPEKRGAQVIRDYVADMEAVEKHIAEYAKDPRQQAIAPQVLESIRNTFRTKTMKWISAKSRCISSMITGPANFPVRRAEKANAAEHARLKEMLDYSRAMIGYASKALDGVIPTVEKKASELELLKIKLQGAEKWQEHMKTANALLRKKDFDAIDNLFHAAYSVAGDANAARQAFLRSDNKWWGAGYAPFELSNNNANIKRMRERVALLEQKAAAAQCDNPAPVQQLDGVEVIRNAQEDRLQLIFSGKPDESIRAILKKNGFKWSPRFGAWQRQLTANAERALEWYIVPALKGAAT